MTDREMLERLVRLGSRFRRTPVVDDDFPQLRDEFDMLLAEADDHLQEQFNRNLDAPSLTLNPPSLTQCQRMVLEFHERHGIPYNVDMQERPDADMLRVHLINEELSEMCLAIAKRSIIKLSDSIADLLYVVLGTAVTYGLPAQELFLEVHRSNMTKALQKDRSIRVLDKGPDYQPPDIVGVLRKFDRELLGESTEQA